MICCSGLSDLLAFANKDLSFSPTGVNFILPLVGLTEPVVVFLTFFPLMPKLIPPITSAHIPNF